MEGCREASLVLNGEIYNYLGLKSELEARGHHFRSGSDSEVLLHAYEQWGISEALSRIEGIFAGVIADELSQTMFVFRDSVGVKPAFVRISKNGLWAASEVAALLAIEDGSPTVNASSLRDFLVYRTPVGRATEFKDVLRLLPGEILEYRPSSGTMQWSTLKPKFSPEIDINENFADVVRQSVLAQCQSDTAIGILLSSGIDSSVIASFARDSPRVEVAFTLDNGDVASSETREAERISAFLGLRHVAGSVQDYELGSIEEALETEFVELFAHPGALNLDAICAVAAESVKVVLSGDGGDELVGGYSWHKDFESIVRSPTLRARFLYGQFRENLGENARLWSQFDSKTRLAWLYAMLRGSPSPARIRNWEKRLELTNLGSATWLYENLIDLESQPREMARKIDSHVYLPYQILTKVDLMSMKHGLECRPPLVSERILEYCRRSREMGRVNEISKNGLLSGAPSIVRDQVSKSKKGFGLRMPAAEVQRISRGGLQELMLERRYGPFR